jgi:hypothetical protein
MSPLKLKMLPDRETTKVTFTASAELRQLLQAYAQLYSKEYGKREAVEDLIPFMLEAFINTDGAFRQLLRKTNERKSKPSTLSDNPPS